MQEELCRGEGHATRSRVTLQVVSSLDGFIARKDNRVLCRSVTGKRPMPYRETPPFSLTFKLRPHLSLLLTLAFSARRPSSSACISDSLRTIYFPNFLPSSPHRRLAAATRPRELVTTMAFCPVYFPSLFAIAIPSRWRSRFRCASNRAAAPPHAFGVDEILRSCRAL
jgi:hypothetical protein